MKKARKEDNKFSKRQSYANKEMSSNFSMMNTNFKTIEVMIINLQNKKCKTKLKFNRTISNYYDVLIYLGKFFWRRSF